jgi:uncharacterized protein (TIGR03663 family)
MRRLFPRLLGALPPPVITVFLRQLPLLLVAVAAFWLRTRALDSRPMHADEANQAVKTGELLEAGRYAFDPRDHHGPTLYYAAAGIARLRGESSLVELSETTVRLVPAIAGTAAVVLLALLTLPSPAAAPGRTRSQGLGRWPALAAATLLALSPPAVYYSRYFVQETLLLAFFLAALVCAQRWWRTGLTRWAVAAGACAGLAQATKASAPLFFAIAALAWWLTRARGTPAPTRRPYRDLAAAAVAAAVVAAVLYSSFLTHPAGIRDALAAYGHAFARFGADAAPTGHEKPWWYYLRLFGWFRTGGLVWHQAGFSAFAVAGLLVAAFGRDRFLRGVAVHTAGIAAAYSVFAYKTPWHAVHFVPGLAVLAAAALAAVARAPAGRLLAGACAVGLVASLLPQLWRVAYLRPADQRNPWAYVHSAPDVLKVRPLAQTALAAPGAARLPVRVIGAEYWPLPWYLRGLSDVGYWADPPADCDGAIIFVSQAYADTVRTRLRAGYRESILGLRPGVLLTVFIRDDSAADRRE